MARPSPLPPLANPFGTRRGKTLSFQYFYNLSKDKNYHPKADIIQRFIDLCTYHDIFIKLSINRLTTVFLLKNKIKINSTQEINITNTLIGIIRKLKCKRV